MRIVAVFNKSERLRHIGHLDLMRAMHRALRRSGLPVQYSKGFNPHINMSFASALSVGYIGPHEVMDVCFDGEVTEEDFVTAMNRALPPELQVLSARAVDDRHTAMMALVKAASYDMILQNSEEFLPVRNAIEHILAQESVIAMRKTKSGMKECDIRPLIYELTMEENRIHCVLALEESQSCKPDMLLKTIGSLIGRDNGPNVRVYRNMLLGRNESNELCPVETL